MQVPRTRAPRADPFKSRHQLGTMTWRGIAALMAGDSERKGADGGRGGRERTLREGGRFRAMFLRRKSADAIAIQS